MDTCSCSFLFSKVQDDDSQTVDNMGAGYSFFKKQQVDLQPFSQAPSPVLKQDLSEYMFSSALKPNTAQQKQQQPINTNINQLVREPFQRQQQQQQLAFDQMQQNNFQPALTQQQRNIFGQLAPQDAETWSPQQQQQILIPQVMLPSSCANRFPRCLINSRPAWTVKIRTLVASLVNSSKIAVSVHCPKKHGSKCEWRFTLPTNFPFILLFSLVTKSIRLASPRPPPSVIEVNNNRCYLHKSFKHSLVKDNFNNKLRPLVVWTVVGKYSRSISIILNVFAHQSYVFYAVLLFTWKKERKRKDI